MFISLKKIYNRLCNKRKLANRIKINIIKKMNILYDRRPKKVENILYSIGGILIPFFGTSFGSAFVFFIKKQMSENFQKAIVGFASGVMLAASVWSLILPSVEMAESQGKIVWLPAAIGLIARHNIFDFYLQNSR